MLLVMALLYTDPLSLFFLFFPSELHQTIAASIRDVFHAFLGFFSLGVMSRFGRDPESLVSGLAFPYSYLLAMAVILLYSDPGIPTFPNPETLPKKLPAFGHSAATIAISFLARVVALAVFSALKAAHVRRTTKRRFVFYHRLSLWVIGVEVVVQGITAMFGFLEVRVVNEVFSVALFAGYAIVMSAAHDLAKRGKGGEYEVGRGSSGGGDLGVDVVESVR
jgi:hypothetical protein